jgi:hypothetical protein
MPLRFAGACLLLSLPYSSCGATHRVTVQFYIADGYRFSQAERDTIQRTADTAAAEVDKLLPALPPNLILKVQAGKGVKVDTGEAVSPALPNVVYWTVDPHHRGGVATIATAHLRQSLFPVWHYLVRRQTLGDVSLMDHVVGVGMGALFARDFADATIPWDDRPENVSVLVNQVLALPPTAQVDRTALQVGTYLVDKALKSSGKSSAQLVAASTEDVLRMAGIK